MPNTIAVIRSDKESIKYAVPYVWDNGKWNKAIPFVRHTDKNWHPTYQKGICDNLKLTSVAPDGTPYNPSGTTPGYYNGHYASGSNNGLDDNYVCTGFIQMKEPLYTLYFKGAEWANEDHTRFLVYKTPTTDSTQNDYTIKGNRAGTPADFSTFGTFEVLDSTTKYYKFTLSDYGRSKLHNKYYRLSLKGTGENLIISHNEPIP